MTLQRATLIPFDDQSTAPQLDQKIVLDFNPETLTIKVSNTVQEEPARNGRQKRQFVGSSTSTLTFDAVFDSTRPTNDAGKPPSSTESQEQLDVRERTKLIARLLQVSNQNAKQPAPKRVRFSWGSIVFDGIIDTYSEVLEYFSPEGVPLRSKVSLSFKEQSFEYRVESSERAQLAGFSGAGAGSAGGVGQSPDTALGQLGAGIAQARDVASQNGLDSLLEIGVSGGLSFDARLSVGGALGVDAGFSASGGLSLGVGVDLGFSAGASLDVSAGAAIQVFGGAAVQAAIGGGNVDLSTTASSDAKPQAGNVTNPTPTAWAPNGPTAGSRAAALAATVTAQRAAGAPPEPLPPAGGAFTATTIPMTAPATSVPVRGSPPLVSARFNAVPSEAVFVKARMRPSATDSLTGDRPRWETLSPATRVAASSGSGCCACGGGTKGAPLAVPTHAPAPSSRASAPCGCAQKGSSW